MPATASTNVNSNEPTVGDEEMISVDEQENSAGNSSPATVGGGAQKKSRFRSSNFKVHGHPEDHDTDDEDEFDDYDEKKFYFLFMQVATLIVLSLLAVAASGPQWAIRRDGNVPFYNQTTQTVETTPAVVGTFLGNIPAVPEYNMWAHCQCYPTERELCPTVVDFFLGGKIVSLIAVGAELMIIGLFAFMYSGFFRRYHRMMNLTACVFSCFATGALLLSFAAFSSVYARTWCGEVVRRRGFASWIYGLRITEFVFMFIITIGVSYQAKKRSKRFAKTFLFGVFGVFCSGIISTTARAWIQMADGSVEIGLWQACFCWLGGCNSETSYFESMEAFMILGMLCVMFFLAAFFIHISKWTQWPLLFAASCCLTIVMALFWAWHGKSFCGNPSAKDRLYAVSYPIYLVLVAWVVLIIMQLNLGYRWFMVDVV